MDVEAVHQKMSKDERPQDKFYQHIAEQMEERNKQWNKSVSMRGRGRGFRGGMTSYRGRSYAQNELLCYHCREPGHMQRFCPALKKEQEDFRRRVTGPAEQGSKRY